MRYLLVAYDYPPIPSPQALRWAYLTRELAMLGNEVHVLAPDVDGYGDVSGLGSGPGVVVHRCSAGVLTGYLVRKRRMHHRKQAEVREASGSVGGVAAAPPARVAGPEGLNWKGRLFERINRIASSLYFPDLRAEWVRPARAALDRLLADIKPDVVISSHEPPVSIPLGLHAKQRGFRWVADLGDPVLAPYTPRRWRRHAFRLESSVCRKADLVTTTTARAVQTLITRHRVPHDRTLLLTQGYDHRIRDDECASPVDFDATTLELVYTGSFYSFRDPAQLLDAVTGTPGVRLTVASVAFPPALVEASERAPGSVRLVGFLGHRQSLALQRAGDILVNIANADPIQVPGKLYEYLGSRARILSVGDDPESASARLLSELSAGWLVPNSTPDIAAVLRRALDEKRSNGAFARRLPMPAEEAYTWHAIATRMHERCAGLANGVVR